MLQCALVDDGGLGVYRFDRSGQRGRKIILGNLNQFRSDYLEFVQNNAFVFVTSLSDKLFILGLLVWLHRVWILQVVSLHP